MRAVAFLLLLVGCSPAGLGANDGEAEFVYPNIQRIQCHVDQRGSFYELDSDDLSIGVDLANQTVRDPVISGDCAGFTGSASLNHDGVFYWRVDLVGACANGSRLVGWFGETD